LLEQFAVWLSSLCLCAISMFCALPGNAKLPVLCIFDLACSSLGSCF